MNLRFKDYCYSLDLSALFDCFLIFVDASKGLVRNNLLAAGTAVVGFATFLSEKRNCSSLG